VRCLNSSRLLKITRVSSKSQLCLFRVRFLPIWHSTVCLFYPEPHHPTPNGNICIGFCTAPSLAITVSSVLCGTKFVL